MNEQERAAYLDGLITAKQIVVSVLMEFEAEETCRHVDTGLLCAAVLVCCSRLIDAIGKVRRCHE